jgi:hypothetical protein
LQLAGAGRQSTTAGCQSGAGRAAMARAAALQATAKATVAGHMSATGEMCAAIITSSIASTAIDM